MYLYDTGMQALRVGAIPGYDMTDECTLVKLMWILGEFSGDSLEKIRKMVLQDYAGEISGITSAKLKRVWE